MVFNHLCGVILSAFLLQGLDSSDQIPDPTSHTAPKMLDVSQDVPCPIMPSRNKCPLGQMCCYNLDTTLAGCCKGPGTCCSNGQKGTGCCLGQGSVCCLPGNRCCPHGYVCSPNGKQCWKRTNEENTLLRYLTQDHEESLTKNQQATREIAGVNSEEGEGTQRCTEGQRCPDEYTCCEHSDDKFACCPLREATCCKDDKTCCPKGYKCTKSSCIKSPYPIEGTWQSIPSWPAAKVQATRRDKKQEQLET